MAEIYSFLFDECLTPDLVGVANSLGHAGAHVVYRGMMSYPDRAVAQYVLENNMVFVTNNRRGFLNLYAELELHSGLVVIVPNVVIKLQEELFACVVDALDDKPDIINKLVEVDIERNVTFTDWPPILSNTAKI